MSRFIFLTILIGLALCRRMAVKIDLSQVFGRCRERWVRIVYGGRQIAESIQLGQESELHRMESILIWQFTFLNARSLFSPHLRK